MSVQKDANGAILKTKVKNKTTLQTYESTGTCLIRSDMSLWICVVSSI